MRNAFRLMLVALFVWGRQLCPAAEPVSLAQAMQERSALGKALTNQFARPGGEASAEGSPIGLNLAAALLVAAALAAHRLAPLLKRRFGSWFPAAASPTDLVPTLLEEASIIAFFEALKDGPTGPVARGASLATQARAPATAPASDAAPDRLGEFYDAIPRRLAELRTQLSESGHALDEATRQTKLLESFQRVSALRESAGLPEVLPIWQVLFALEGLLKRLSTKPAGLSPSVLQTAVGALDLLEHLCRQRVKPNLVSEPPVRLLAVDDDPTSRYAMSLALTKLFNAPDLAPDGQAGLALVERQAYDVIFLDVEMPGMDGFELCAKIRETKLNRTTPVVFVTRHSDFASYAKSTLNGGCDLLGKPFLVFELVLKAITLVLQIRLNHGAAEPCSASNEASGAPTPPAPVAPCAPVEPPAGGLHKALSMCRRIVKRASRLPPGRLALELSTAGEKPAATDETPVPLLGPSGSGAPGTSKRQGVLCANALAQLQELQMRLQAVQPDAVPADHLELVGKLYVHVDQVCAAAQHAKLGAAFRLGSALENMLKKLLDHPKSWTPSTVQAAASGARVAPGPLPHRSQSGPRPSSYSTTGRGR